MFAFPKSTTTIVADYIFSSDHEYYDVSWLFRKLERHQNDISWTSDACPSPCQSNDTPMSKLRPHASTGEYNGDAGSLSAKNKVQEVKIPPGEHVKAKRRIFFDNLDARNCKNFERIDDSSSTDHSSTSTESSIPSSILSSSKD